MTNYQSIASERLVDDLSCLVLLSEQKWLATISAEREVRMGLSSLVSVIRVGCPDYRKTELLDLGVLPKAKSRVGYVPAPG